MKEHGDTCPPYRLGIEDVAQICYGTKPPMSPASPESQGIESTDKRTSLDIAREAAHEIMACFVPSSQWDKQYLGNITGIIQRCIEEATESEQPPSQVQEPAKSNNTWRVSAQKPTQPSREEIDSLCRKAGLPNIEYQKAHWKPEIIEEEIRRNRRLDEMKE